MNVSISFFGLQRKLAKTDCIQVPLSNKIRLVSDLFKYIEENYPKLSLGREMVLVTVNDNISSMDQRLYDKDEVSFIPPIGGG